MKRILIAAATLLSACATLPAGTASQRDHGTAFRATGRAHIQARDFAGDFDLALLVAPPDRLRVDVMLPVGTPAAVFFVQSRRWILLDPAASVAWHGTTDTLGEVLRQASPALQGTIMLALQAARRYLPASFPDTATSRVTDSAAWTITFADPASDNRGWWRHWSARRGPDSVEVEWQDPEPLAKEQRWLLEPRVPQSFSWRSWRSAPDATDPAPRNDPRNATNPAR